MHLEERLIGYPGIRIMHWKSDTYYDRAIYDYRRQVVIQYFTSRKQGSAKLNNNRSHAGASNLFRVSCLSEPPQLVNDVHTRA